ncbi:MAG: hypothetical protein JNL18_11840 [Planctomycetaceae bacterium]|nr:hypothetical protein [Planctomycetaceae bacterium]
MLFAVGWAVVRSSRDVFSRLGPSSLESVECLQALDTIDDECDRADLALFDAFERFITGIGDSCLSWQFQRQLNNERGVLTFSSSRNHRGGTPVAVEVLEWLAVNGTGSYGILYLHDDEDIGESAHSHGRDGVDRSNVFRVWRLLSGQVKEFDDPFLSPIVPIINPGHYA